ncbi:hypothetical protein [Chitinophaga barathri]|uniref:Uncharacterized protein n=1 Tax=Chitinophaga barathri TaxID=1647451 RepID=A0A3N4MCV7_9BACT|nr:hypothetical protein [Chitinophaga barathri]RPD41762.1 hypothetical protein EG028_06230 [Chitinophaga barathri]
MMDETDIRIGNMVWYYDYNMIETPFRIEGILDGHIYNSLLPRSRLPLEKVHPITLEADHLLQFGFLPGEKEYGEDPDIYTYKYTHKDSVYIRDMAGVFQPVTVSENGTIPYGRPLLHLHQLQNLFYDLTRDNVFTN